MEIRKDELALNPFLGKTLQEELRGLRSLRYWNYRIIYRFSAKKRLIEIVLIERHSLVYEKIKRLLAT